MSKSIQELRELRAAKAAEARKIVDADQYDKASEEKVDALFTEIEDLDRQIDRLQQLLNVEASQSQRINVRREGPTGRSISEDEANHRLMMEKSVFNSWLRGGINALSAAQREFQQERRERSIIQGTMSTTTDSEGGYLVPDDFSANLLEELLAYGGVRSVANVIQTQGGNLIEWPTVDETSQVGELVAENASVAAQDIAFGVKSIGAYKYSSKGVAVPFELLQDARIDIEGYINKALRDRLGRITNQHFTTGTGSGQPNGVVTAAAEGKVGTTGQTTTIIYDDLVDLEHSVDPAYRVNGCSWMFNDVVLKALKKLKDGDSRPIWLPGLAVSEPDTILSYPYVVNQNMAVMAANAKSVLFGDFSKYIVRDVMEVMLFRMTDSAYTNKGQVGFLAFMRSDGDLIDQSNSALKYYQNSAT